MYIYNLISRDTLPTRTIKCRSRRGKSGTRLRQVSRQLNKFIAGWSSLVARRAHNPKVVGSNPAPATICQKTTKVVFFVFLYSFVPKNYCWISLTQPTSLIVFQSNLLNRCFLLFKLHFIKCFVLTVFNIH